MAKDKNQKKEGLFSRLRRKPKPGFEVEELIQKVQEDPEDMRARLKLADAYLKFEESGKALDQYLTVAETYADKGFYPKAVAVYKQILTVEPKLIEVHIKLAGLYHKLGLMGEVVAQYQKAASIYEADGKIKQALDTMKRLIELSPENVKGRIKLGQRYLNEGFREDAYLQFIEVAKLFKKQEKNPELVKLYEGLLDRGFESLEIIQELTNMYTEIGQQDKVLKMIESLKGEMANSVTVLELYADVAEQAKQPKKSISALHRVIQAYESTGRSDVIRETCERILGLDAEDPTALASLEQMRLADEQAIETAEIEEIPGIEPIEELEMIPEVEELAVEVEEIPAAEEVPEVALKSDTEEIIEVEDLPVIEEEPEVETIPEIEEMVEPEELPHDEVEQPLKLERLGDSDEPEGEEIFEIEKLPDIEEGYELSEPTLEQEEGLAGPDMLREEEEEIPLRLEPEEDEEEAPVIEPTLHEEEPSDELPTIDQLEEQEKLEDEEEIPIQPLDEETGDELPTMDALQPTSDDEIEKEPPEAASEDEPVLATDGEIDMFDQEIPVEESEFEEQEIEPEMEIPELPELEEETVPEPEPEPEPEPVDYSDMSDQETYDHINHVCDIYLDSGLNDKALEYLKLSVEKNPESIPVYEKLLSIHDSMDEEEESQKALDTLINLCDKHGNTDKLLEYVDRKYETDPTNLRIAEKLVSLIAPEEPDRAIVLLFGMIGQVKEADDLDKAAEYLLRVLEIEPDNSKAFEDLLGLRMSFNDIPGSIELLQSMADTAIANDNFETARKHHEKALSLKPAEPVSNKALLEIYEKQDDSEALLAHLAKLTESAISKKDNDAAFDYLEQTLTVEPESLDALLMKKNLQLSDGKQDAAIQSLFTISSIQTGMELFDESEASLREILKLSSRNTEARTKLKELYIDKGDKDKAVAELFTLAEQAQADSQAEEYESLLQQAMELDTASEEGLRKIADLYQESDRKEQAVETLFTLADVLIGKGDTAGAESVLREVVSLQPDSIDARLRLRDHYLATDDTERAVIEIRKAAELYLEGDRKDDALENFERIVYLDESDIEARKAMKNIYQDLGNNEAAVEQLMTISVLHHQAGDLKEAGSTLREILKIDKENMGAFESLKDIYLETDQIDNAIELCNEKAEEYYKEKKVDNALALFGEIVSFAPNSIQTAIRYKDILLEMDEIGSGIEQLIRLSELYANNNQYNEAEESLKQLLLYNSNHIEALDLLKKLYIDSDQKAKALDLLYGFVDIDLHANDFDNARNHINELLELAPDNPQALEYQAKVEQLTGNTADAISIFMKLVEIHSDKPKESSKYLNKAIGLDPDNIETRRTLADLYIQTDDQASAYKQLIEIFNLELAAEQFENAEKTLLECTGMDAENETGWSKLAGLYEKTSQVPKALDALFKTADIRMKRDNVFGAEEMLNRVLQLDENNVKALSLLSELHINAGDTDQAIRELFQLVQGNMNEGATDSALELCRKILELDEQNEQALWKMVELYKSKDDEESMLQTYFTIDDLYKKSEDFTSSDQVLRKALSLAEDNQEIHERLLVTFKATEDTQGSIDEYFRYADLVEKPDTKLQLMTEVLSIEENNDLALTKMKEIFLDQGEHGKAIEQLFTLSENAASNGNTESMVDYLEEIMILDSLNEKAQKTLVDHFMESDDNDRALGLMIDFAKSADEAGKPDLSAATYEEILRINPTYLVALECLKDKAKSEGLNEKAIGFLFSMTDIAMDEQKTEKAGELLHEITDIEPSNLDAWERIKSLHQEAGDTEGVVSVIFEMLEKSADVIPIEKQKEYLEEILDQDPENENALRESRKIYKEAGENDKEVEIIFKLAQIQSQAGKTSQLEEFYREVLDIDPQSIQAHESLCGLYKEQGLKDKAASEYFTLADLALESDAPEKAIEYHHEVIDLGVARERSYKELKKIYKEQADDSMLIETCFNLVELAIEKENNANAESLLKEVIELSPENEKAHLALKDIYVNQDNSSAACDELFTLADIAGDSNDQDAELAYIEQVVALDDKNIPALHRLKDYYQKQKDSAKSLELIDTLYSIAEENEDVAAQEELIRESIDADPMNPDQYSKLVDLYKQQGESEKAVIELFNLVEMFQETERESQIPEILQQIVGIDRNNEEAHLRLRDLYLAAEDKKASIGELFALVRIATKADRNKLAEKHLRHIFKLDSKNRKAKEKLAEIFMATAEQEEKTEDLFERADKAVEEGQPAKAKSAYMEVLSLDPDNIDAKSRLNQLYLQETRLQASAPVEELDIFETSAQSMEPEPEAVRIERSKTVSEKDVDLFSEEFTSAAEVRLDSTFDKSRTEPEDVFAKEDIFTDIDNNVQVEEVDVFAEPAVEETEPAQPKQTEDIVSEQPPVAAEAPEEIDAFGEDDQYETDITEEIGMFEAPDEEAAEKVEEVDLFAVPEEKAVPAAEPEKEEIDLFADALGTPGQPREFTEETKEEAAESESVEPEEEKGGLFDDVFGTEDSDDKSKKSAVDSDAFDDLLSDLSSEEPMQEAAGDDLFGDIIQDFKAGLSEDQSENAETHFNLGIAYREMDSIKEAITEFERALALGDPNMEFTINQNLGECYEDIGQYAQAAQYIQSALDVSADVDEREILDLMVDLGQVYIQLEEYAKAIDLLNEVDNVNSNYRGCRNIIKKAKKKSKEGKKVKKGKDDDNVGYV